MERLPMSSPAEKPTINPSGPKPRLRLIPLDDTVVFPSMGITLTIDVGDDERVVLVPRHDNEFLEVGTIAEVSEQIRLPGGGRAVALSGEHRALIGAAQTGPTAAFLRAIAEPGALADSAGYSPTISYEQKVELLRTIDVTERLELAVKLQRESLAELQVRKRIREDVQEGAEKQQREYFLRKQMDSIRKELGDDDASVAEEYRAKIDEADMPDEVSEQALKELARLERMGEQTGESSMIRTYLDWLIAVPWGKRSDEHLDPVAARAVLDADHAGLEDVKDRVTEYLAVRKLREDRGIEADPKSGAILTLIGPPGTGKTSIGESIARATGREFVRMSLGGVRDEAEIRGHRRTYIGALPGRLVRALRDAGTMNPVILLDEVDKVGADWRGDPSAALLEVLDPAQNHSFRDHYLDVELDLSQVMFLATANVADTIPGPLLDRMEVIRFDGYTSEEKLAIAKGYLWPRQRDRNGLREDEVEIADDVLRTIVAEYTREAGVRNLERNLGTVLRKTATKIASAQSGEAEHKDAGEDGAKPSKKPTAEDAGKPAKAAKKPKASKASKSTAAGIEIPVKIDLDAVRDALGRQKFFQESAARTATPGVATGLAVTGAGGDVLFVEATAMKNREFHGHVPAGAIPKDGSSAGVTMVTALASLLSGRAVKHTVGMTGEVTLQAVSYTH